MKQALKKEKYSVDEMIEQLRKKDVFRVADVEFASLDTNGDLSVLLKKAKQPLVREDVFNIITKFHSATSRYYRWENRSKGPERSRISLNHG